MMNGFNATLRGPRSQQRNTFSFDPTVELPDTVGMYFDGYEFIDWNNVSFCL